MILTHGANSLARGDVVEIGGRKYPFVKIGDQLWMAENLDYKFDVNGSQIPIGGSGSPTTPHAWYYNNNETDYGIDGTYKCGLLYNWYAAMYLDDNKSTLLPNGWHLPSIDEFYLLASSVGGESTGGTKLKSIDNSIVSGFPSDWGGTDDYGFNALPTGYFYDNKFEGLNRGAYFITTTEVNETTVKGCYLYKPYTKISYSDDAKVGATTIRLVKDAT